MTGALEQHLIGSSPALRRLRSQLRGLGRPAVPRAVHGRAGQRAAPGGARAARGEPAGGRAPARAGRARSVAARGSARARHAHPVGVERLPSEAQSYWGRIARGRALGPRLLATAPASFALRTAADDFEPALLAALLRFSVHVPASAPPPRRRRRAGPPLRGRDRARARPAAAAALRVRGERSVRGPLSRQRGGAAAGDRAHARLLDRRGGERRRRWRRARQSCGRASTRYGSAIASRNARPCWVRWPSTAATSHGPPSRSVEAAPRSIAWPRSTASRSSARGRREHS